MHSCGASTACKHRVSGSLSLPSRGPFHLSFTVLSSIGHWVVFSLTGWSPLFPARFLVSRSTLDPAMPAPASLTGLSPSTAGLSRTVPLQLQVTSAVLTPVCSHSGLGSFHSARRYSGNHFCFLFLRLLRCFSSPGSPPHPMDSGTDTQALPAWVSPFRHLRILAYLPLPAAFRSLSRLSSAPSAKASALCSFLLNRLRHAGLPCAASLRLLLSSVAGSTLSFSSLGLFLSGCLLTVCLKAFMLPGFLPDIFFGIRFSRYDSGRSVSLPADGD